MLASQVPRMPVPKQGNKDTLRVLIEVAELAPSESPELALTHATDLPKLKNTRSDRHLDGLRLKHHNVAQCTAGEMESA